MGAEQPDSGGSGNEVAALRRGKLEMWNNDFYWAADKQTHISLDAGMNESPLSWKPHMVLLTLMKSATKPLCQHFTSCPVSGMWEGGHQ